MGSYVSRLSDSEASFAARKLLVDKSSEACFWRDCCAVREKRSAVSARAIFLAVVAFFRRLRAAAVVCLSSGLRASGNERGGLCRVAAAGPVVRSGKSDGWLCGGGRALGAPPRHVGPVMRSGGGGGRLGGGGHGRASSAPLCRGMCNVAASRPASSSGGGGGSLGGGGCALISPPSRTGRLGGAAEAASGWGLS